MKILDGKIGLLLILLGVALGYFLIKRTAVQPNLSEARSVAAKAAAGPKQSIISPPPKPDNSRELDEARKHYNIVVLNGITQIPATVDGDRLRVTILPKPEAQWCKTGDFDLIKALAANTKDKLLTLSLESVSKGGTKRSQSFSLGELNANKSVTFEIPSRDGAYGLYLCSDQGRKGDCSSKKVIPTAIWSAPLDGIRKMAVNKIFYFQLLHVKNKTLNIIPSSAWGRSNLKSLKFRLGKWMGDDVDSLEKMDDIISKIRPMPARVADRQIEIPLPYNDLRCVSH